VHVCAPVFRDEQLFCFILSDLDNPVNNMQPRKHNKTHITKTA